MRIRAAVIEERGGPFELTDLDLDEPRPDEVLVRVVAAGICRTDLHIRDQAYPVPLPVVAGHEGAGIIERVGAGVSTVAPGDQVVMSYPYCGQCRFCQGARYSYCERGFELLFGGQRLDGSNALSRDGEVVHGHMFQQSSFATHALATEGNVVKMPPGSALELLGPLACGLQTGAGTVMNVLHPRPEESVAVFGTGSVGLAAVMAARIVGAYPILAVDVLEERLALALDLGATHTINAARDDTAARVRSVTKSGADYVIETSGVPEMLTVALEALVTTGTAVLVGAPPVGARAEIDMKTLLNGRTLRGIIEGDACEKLFIPQLLGLYQRGLFPFERLIRRYAFDDINQAVADMEAGRVVKPVLQMG
ncbi:MAG: NAD(P)-dependent alcohol dehydrogenase [Acidimicrobiales bacterium]